MIVRLLCACSVAALLLFQSGCGGSPGMQRVTGKVKFNGGEIPASEIRTIRFEPIAGTQAEGQSKGASADIQPDGSFTLGTIEKNDGAYVGEYKVCFTILKTYVGRESLVDKKFTEHNTTPHTAKVTKGGSNHFEFDVN